MPRVFSPEFIVGGSLIESIADSVVRRLLDVLVAINLEERRYYSAHGHPLPKLYESGVRYVREKYESDHPEQWLDVVELYRRGVGDCEDLACARAAELQEQGELATALFQAKRRPTGGRLIHIVVRRADGSIEDPSRALGM